MYYCIHDYSQEKSDFFFFVYSANCISEFYMYMYTVHVHILYTFISMLPPCQEGSSAAKSVGGMYV